MKYPSIKTNASCSCPGHSAVPGSLVKPDSFDPPCQVPSCTTFIRNMLFLAHIYCPRLIFTVILLSISAPWSSLPCLHFTLTPRTISASSNNLQLPVCLLNICLLSIPREELKPRQAGMMPHAGTSFAAQSLIPDTGSETTFEVKFSWSQNIRVSSSAS